MIYPLPRSAYRNYHAYGFYCCLVLIFNLLFIQVPASPDALHTGTGLKPLAVVDGATQEDRQTKQLELGIPIERKLGGGESHYYAYQLALTAGQYARLVVYQRGIDLVVKLFGQNGDQIAEFDSEVKPEGQETISWVAEEAGKYRVDVVAKYKNVPSGQYEIKVAELRSATSNDRELDEARKLIREFQKLYDSGKYDESRQSIERALEIRERVSGPEHLGIAEAVENLGLLYYTKGEYAKAEPMYKRSLAIRERLQGAENPNIAQTITRLADLYNQIGDLANAESLYQRALTIRQNGLGPAHFWVGASLNNLANHYLNGRGDYAKAEPLYQSSLSVMEKWLGPEHLIFLNILNNQALLYFRMGDYGKAEKLYQRVLEVKGKLLGPEDPLIANELFNLAVLYNVIDEYEKAEPLYQRALTIVEKLHGPDHIFVAMVLNDLAHLYSKSGNYAKAEPLAQRALTIREKLLPPYHINIAESLFYMAAIYAKKGDITQAVAFLSRAGIISERNFASNLAIGSERQKLAYLSLVSREIDSILSLHSRAAPNDLQALNLAFTTILRRKTRGLDVMTDTIATLRRHARPEDRALFDRLAEARSQLAAVTLKDSDEANSDIARVRFNSLQEEIEKLEGELSSRSREFREQKQPVTLSAVQAALPGNSALVEFAIFTPMDIQTEKNMSPRYLAYILKAQGQPEWRDLGEAEVINRAVDAWREALRDPNRTDVKLLARAVDEKVMRPVRSLLGDAHHLLIAPDSRLNLIPFAGLVDEQNQYLVERYSISYLTSGRDLLRLQSPQPSRGASLVVANPDFGRFATIAMRTDRGSGKARAQLDPTQIFFQPLPGTEDEALAIKALLPKASVLRREQATETALKQASGPRILHIATHGFFLDNQDAAPVENDPLRIGSSGTTAVLASAEANPYTLQFEATPEFETAQERAKGLRTRGLNAYIIKSEVNGKGTYFRLRAGNFRTQTEAQKYGADLQEKGVVSDFFVTRYEPPQRGLMEQVSSANEPRSDLRLSKFATKVEEPLLRSGLALAGANQGKIGDDDGILTAAEAAYLDLSGTKLVVLSACDTGVGEVRKGEGVQGLRRALVLAGSESQVMSLWPVSDESTKDLMVPYYKALQQGEGRSEALRQVQLRMLRGRKDQRHPFFWAAFIQSGEWANLDGQR